MHSVILITLVDSEVHANPSKHSEVKWILDLSREQFGFRKNPPLMRWRDYKEHCVVWKKDWIGPRWTEDTGRMEDWLDEDDESSGSFFAGFRNVLDEVVKDWYYSLDGDDWQSEAEMRQLFKPVRDAVKEMIDTK